MPCRRARPRCLYVGDDGRCWAQTSDLRLLKAEVGGTQTHIDEFHAACLEIAMELVYESAPESKGIGV